HNRATRCGAIAGGLEERCDLVEAEDEIGAVALCTVAIVRQADEVTGRYRRNHARKSRNWLPVVWRGHAVGGSGELTRLRPRLPVRRRNFNPSTQFKDSIGRNG